MHKLVCDKCRRDDLAPTRPGNYEVKIQMPGRHVVIHLCDQCRPHFIRWIDTPYDQEAAA